MPANPLSERASVAQKPWLAVRASRSTAESLDAASKSLAEPDEHPSKVMYVHGKR